MALLCGFKLGGRSSFSTRYSNAIGSAVFRYQGGRRPGSWGPSPSKVVLRIAAIPSRRSGDMTRTHRPISFSMLYSEFSSWRN